MPSTRYQGSKLKIIDWIWSEISQFDFESMIDIMGGTGIVSYKGKQHGKRVAYNDVLRFNYHIGSALLQNNTTRLDDDDIAFLTTRHAGIKYDRFIERVFKDVFYTDSENAWLDMFIGNLRTLGDKSKISLALASLFQACVIKRPYNLFHRKNLYLRLADVKRTFGNKTTWDQSFDFWFEKFAKEYNSLVFSNRKTNLAMNYDVFGIPDKHHDLVYFDPPYTNSKNSVDYLEYYHFLEGLCMYLEHGAGKWSDAIDWTRKPLPIKHSRQPWNDRAILPHMFDKVASKFKNSVMVISWNNDGVPSPRELKRVLSRHYDNIEIKSTDYQYVLSPKKSKEVLLVAS